MGNTPHLSDPTLADYSDGAAGIGLVSDGEETGNQAALPFPVVGIGGSAGALEASLELLRHVSTDADLALVLLLDLPADSPVLLARLLERVSSLPVEEAREGEALLPGRVYVPPPGRMVRMQRDGLRFTPRGTGEPGHALVDTFFRSLALQQRSLAIGVVLSGMDSDGVIGLNAIKSEGGISIAQDERTARAPGMPRAAVAFDHTDFVLEPAKIGAELGRLAEQFHAAGPPSRLAAAEPQDRHSLSRIYALLRGVSGVDFQLYKQTTVQRRIQRQMLLHKLESMPDYVRLLQTEPREVARLHEDILINYTRFFREPEMFTALRDELLPQLMQERSADQPIRMWAPGCSSGEEVYSLAMILLEFAATLPVEPAIQVFGTDLSAASVDRARHGAYPESIEQDVSPERLRRFFVRTEKGYQTSKRMRDLCIFAKQNLAHDPPFSRLDLISCRNVMIYLGPALQNSVLATFHYALCPHGRLVLGGSESIREGPDLFTLIDKRHRFFRKNAGPSRLQSDLGRRPQATEPAEPAPHAHPPAREGVGSVELQRAADRVVLARHGPPGVVVDEQFEVLQIRGQTKPFLELQPGSASLDLLRIVHINLRAAVSDALRRASETDSPVRVDRLQIEVKGTTQWVAVEALPIHQLPFRVRRYLVLFVVSPLPQGPGSVAEPDAPEANRDGDQDERLRTIQRLEQDLASTKLYLQSLVEERDIRHHDLVTAHEEVQSSNEELQSINEELETAKEELQSTNEEVQTINEELRNRNAELSTTSNDLRNLLNSTTIAVVMLDAEMRIRQYTAAAEKLMSLRPADVGRPLRELRLDLSVESLEPLLAEVVESLNTREVEVRDRQGRWYLLRARPYRTSDNRIDGLVVLLIDIDQIRRAQEEILAARDFSQALLEGVPIPLVVLRESLQVRQANRAFLEFSSLAADEVIDRPAGELAEQLWRFPELRPRLAELLREKGERPLLYLEHTVPVGPSERVIRVNARVVDASGERTVLVALDDITAQRQAERLLRQDKERLEGQVERTERALDRTKEELRALAASLFTAQEEERRRVARELHDDLGQRVAMLQVDVERLLQRLSPEEAGVTEALQRLQTRAATLANDLRRIAHQLHPGALDDLGLSIALKGLVEEFGERYGVPVHFSARNVPTGIPPEVSACLYRVAQEALRNVAKHAGQAVVRVSLARTAQGLRLRIRDMGDGFDMADARGNGGLGMISMHERVQHAGGTFAIRSLPGEGTFVMAHVPLRDGEAEG